MDDSIRFFDESGNHRSQWQVGPSDETEAAMGFPPATIQSVLDALNNIEGDEVVIAGQADWAVYDDFQWASFILDVEEARGYLEDYAEQVEAGGLTDQEALDEFLSEISGLGGATDTMSIALSETREGPPANI